MDDIQLKSNAENAWQVWAEEQKVKKRIPPEFLRSIRIAFVSGYIKAHKDF